MLELRVVSGVKNVHHEIPVEIYEWNGTHPYLWGFFWNNHGPYMYRINVFIQRFSLSLTLEVFQELIIDFCKALSSFKLIPSLIILKEFPT